MISFVNLDDKVLVTDQGSHNFEVVPDQDPLRIVLKNPSSELMYDLHLTEFSQRPFNLCYTKDGKAFVEKVIAVKAEMVAEHPSLLRYYIDLKVMNRRA